MSSSKNSPIINAGTYIIYYTCFVWLICMFKKRKGMFYGINCALITLIVGLISSVSIFLWFNLVYNLPQPIEFTSLESRMISPNTWIYNYIEVEDKSAKMNSFYYDHHPSLSKTVNIDLNETVQLDPKSYKYWARFLNKGSKIHVSWQMNQRISFYVIRGNAGFSKWTKGGEQGPYVVSHELIAIKKNNMIMADISDDYYFIMENVEPKSHVSGHAHFYVEATTYDTSRAKGFFGGSFRLDFPFRSEQYIVIKNPSQVSSYTITVNLSSRSHSMIGMAVFTHVVTIFLLLWYKYGGHGQSAIPTSKRKKRPSIVSSKYEGLKEV